MSDRDDDASNDDRGDRFELDLDWDDVGEAYLGALAALFTVAAVLLLVGARLRRRPRPRFRR